MLYLPPPYGLDNPTPGIHISILSDQTTNLERVGEIILEYSCPPFLVSRVKKCLFYSNRYDCIVQSNWFKVQYKDLIYKLRLARAELIFTKI